MGLGEGSFGVVRRAVDKRDQTVVAIKQVDKDQLTRRGLRREDVEREITVMRACEHKNIMRLLDAWEDVTKVCMVFEYCDGGDFGDKLKECADKLEDAEACRYMSHILSAIVF